MSAYVLVDIQVTDPVGYEEYKKLAPPAVTAYGGRYVARGGKTEKLEGDWLPKRLVILEFANVERAKQWLDSPEYQPAKAVRHKAEAALAIAIENRLPKGYDRLSGICHGSNQAPGHPAVSLDTWFWTVGFAVHMAGKWFSLIKLAFQKQVPP